MRLIAKFDDKELGYANKTFKDLTRNWDNLEKRMTGGLFSPFKDKRKLQDLNNYFGKLKTTLAESMAKYKQELQDLEGDGSGGQGTKLFDAEQGLNAAKQNLEDVKQKYEEINKQREKLSKRQEKLGFMPSERQLLRSITIAQDNLERKQEQLSKANQNRPDNKTNTEYLRGQMNKSVNNFDVAAQMAAALKWQYKGTDDQSASYWDMLQNKVTNMEEGNESLGSVLEAQLNNLENKEVELNEALTEAMQKFKETHKTKWSDLANSLTMDLDNVRQHIQETEDEILANDKSKEFATRFRAALESAEETMGADYKNYGRKQGDSDQDQYERLVMSFKGKQGLADTHENSFWKRFKETSSDGAIQALENQVSTLQNQIKSLQSQQSLARRHDTERANVNAKLQNTGKDLKDAEKETKQAEIAVREWEQALQDVKDRIAEIKNDMGLLAGDTTNNPFDFRFASNAMQGMNDQTDNMQRKWGALGGIGSKFKAYLAGIHGYMKKINPLTKLWHKVILNIYSQVATLVNPLNVFKRAWNDWINRFDNKAWKNTFDVIKYNLTTVIAPFLEWCAKMLLKIAAIANVFTKKWFKVDLFDKAAWQTEQIKKNIGQMTASFDELHSNTDNPDIFNTMFDKGINPDELISPEWVKKLEGWADGLAGIFEKIKENWKWLVAAWAAYKLGKGLLGLLDWGKGFSELLKGLSLGSLLSSLAIAIGLASTLYGIFQDIKLAQKWNQMPEEEHQKTADKGDLATGIGGALIGGGIGWKVGSSALGAALGLTPAAGMAIGATLVGGIALGISSTANVITAEANGDFKMVEKEGVKAGAGIGMAVGTVVGVKIGASLGAFAGPVGAAVGAVIGAGIGFAAAKIDAFFFDVGGKFSKLKVSEEDLTWATEQYNTALGNEYQALQNLQQMEQATGQSGEKLYKMVENGTIKVSDLTTEQKVLYKAYQDYKTAIEETAAALKQQTDYENAALKAKAKESGDFSEFIASMYDAHTKGIYSSEELQDRLSQVYAELSTKEREVFLSQIPEDMRQGVEEGAAQYYSGWEKFKINAGKLWEDFKTGFGNFLSGIGTKLGEIGNGIATTAGNIWDGMKTTAGNIWQSIKIDAADAWEGIKNSAIGQKVGEIATNVGQKWEEIKTAAGKKWDEIKTTASQKWEDIKNSAIGQKVQEIWKNTTDKFEDLKRKASEKWENIKNAASQGWKNIKDAIWGWVDSLWKSITGVFDNIGKAAERTWQRVCNFFSGKGFKTNEEIDSKGNANTSIQPYAVGTNYVPNDQLAYVHKGEAIIPAKYNKPYSPPSDNGRLENAINQLTRQVEQIGQTVNQGIPVKGQFVQRGADLVATVERANNKLSNNVLNNKVYAR